MTNVPKSEAATLNLRWIGKRQTDEIDRMRERERERESAKILSMEAFQY